ncbi:MAG TPA: hypothetical protein VN038_01385 [Dyadobacter sp.]|nr:hypothetical protein [Dyadobacter sp.]
MDNYTTEEGERMHQLWNEIFDQYQEMRGMHGHSVESDVEDNADGQLLRGAITISDLDESWTVEDRLEWLRKKNPKWNPEWVKRTLYKTYKDRLKVGISLLIAELERVMYLENQRIENNDSSTASSSGDPESNG